MRLIIKLQQSCSPPRLGGSSSKRLARTSSGCCRGLLRWPELGWLLKMLGATTLSSLAALSSSTSSTCLWWWVSGHGTWWEGRFLWRRCTVLIEEGSCCFFHVSIYRRETYTIHNSACRPTVEIEYQVDNLLQDKLVRYLLPLPVLDGLQYWIGLIHPVLAQLQDWMLHGTVSVWCFVLGRIPTLK